MKKFTKSVAFVLALVIAFGAMPLAVSAEENTVVPAVYLCPDGNHLYVMHFETVYIYNDSNHLVKRIEVYECGYCSSSYTVDTGTSYYEEHSYTKTLIGTDTDTGELIYKYTCVCGNSYYAS